MVYLSRFCLIFCFSCITIQHITAQQSANLNFKFEETPLKTALEQLEETTGYTFFYLPEWLANISINEDIANATLDEALEQLLAKTTLNFYFLAKEKRIIILRNGLIYDQLPEGFFKDTTTTSVTSTVSEKQSLPPPAFYPSMTDGQNKEIPIARIGKASLKTMQPTYVLNGKVEDETTGEPIPDVAIRIAEENRFTVTDKNGRYSIELSAGYHLLELSAMGIEDTSQGVIMYNNGSLDLKLREGLQQLDEVVVEANAIRNVVDSQTGTEQIDSEESKNIPLVLGERNVLEVAKALPGISSAGEGATGFNVRGGKTDQNLVLLDNAVIYNPTHFFGIFQALNPFTTQKVNIYKGSVPVEFGGRISSVFDIETKNGNVQQFSGEGSIGPVTGNLALEVPIKKDTSALIVGGRVAYADWILKALEDEALNNSQASFFDGIVKYHHQFNEKSELRATAYYSRDRFSITSDSLYNYSNRLFSARWAHQWNENTNAVLTVGNSDYQFGIDFDSEGNRDFALDYGINETELRYKLSHITNEKHLLDYGISTKFYTVNPGSILPLNNNSDVEALQINSERALEGALFFGDRYTITENFLMDIGLRFAFFAALGPSTQRTYQENQPKSEATVTSTATYGSGEIFQTYGGPEGRISLRYLLNPEFSIKASFNNSYQFIHTLSNNTTVSPIDTWKLSDLNIEPQRGYQAALGLYHNFNQNMFEFSLEGYYKRMQNVLDFKTGANLFLNEQVETEILQGQGKAYGVEFLVRKNSGDLNGWLSYTYSRSLNRFDSEFSEERINNGNFFPSNFDKPHDISLVANYRLTRRFSFSMNFAYQTGRPVTYPIGTFRFNNADFVAFSERNQFRIPDYYRLDLGVNIEGNHKKNKLAHSFVTLQVYNVLGRNNPFSVFFVTESGRVKALQSSIFAIPVPSITYNFKF